MQQRDIKGFLENSDIKGMAHVNAKLDKEGLAKLKEVLGEKNTAALPRIAKVVLNMGVGRVASSNPQLREKILEETAKILALISGQKPAGRQARKSIAGFKVREGETVGYVITLRGQRMVDFLERFFNIAIPRMRDFRGIPLQNIDQAGNLTVGLREHIIFPEVATEETRQLYGLEVTIVPTTKSRQRAVELYRALGFPFVKE